MDLDLKCLELKIQNPSLYANSSYCLKSPNSFNYIPYTRQYGWRPLCITKWIEFRIWMAFSLTILWMEVSWMAHLKGSPNSYSAIQVTNNFSIQFMKLAVPSSGSGKQLLFSYFQDQRSNPIYWEFLMLVANLKQINEILVWLNFNLP